MLKKGQKAQVGADGRSWKSGSVDEIALGLAGEQEESGGSVGGRDRRERPWLTRDEGRRETVAEEDSTRVKVEQMERESGGGGVCIIRATAPVTLPGCFISLETVWP